MRRALLGCLAVLAGCDQKTYDEAAVRSQFATEVAPALERSCGTSACHAATDEKFAALNPEYFAFPVDQNGKISGADRLEKAVERTKHKLSSEGGRFAPLLRKPLDESLGGQQHRGGTQYRSVREAEFAMLLGWANAARPTTSEITLSPLEQRFRVTVQPMLREKRCFQSNCHGSGASNFVIFDPGVEGEFDAHATHTNYKTLLPHFNLETPDVMQSRAIRKTVPLGKGGIFHRGGNGFFDPAVDDKSLKILTDFITEVRAAVNPDPTGVVSGLLFVATDATPRKVLDFAVWQPGGDVFSLVPAEPGGTLTNLTQAHHSGPADIRDPAVSHDGQRVAFAMRKSQTDCLNLYVMNVDGSALKQLTQDTGTLPNGIKASNVEPLWGPDERLYFISTRSGELSNARLPLSNLWRIDGDGTGLVRLSYIADNELAPYWRFAHGYPKKLETRTLDLTFTALRGVGTLRRGPLMRVPADFRADYHPHYGTQNPKYQLFTQGSRFNDDREVLILMDEQNVWEGGALAVIDRNLGPVISDQGAPAVVNYTDSLQVLGTLGEEVAHRGYSKSGYYRDPVALPDGKVVVSYSSKPITLNDPLAAPATGLYRMTLREVAPNQTTIATRELLVDVPGKIETDPTPLTIRRKEEVLSPKGFLTFGQGTGELLNFDFAVGLTIARQDSPSNTKPIDQAAFENKAVRVVEHIPFAPADFPNWPDTSTHRIGRGRHGMRRVMAEFPATSDRSFYLKLPAATPFFIQSLDFAHMSNGAFNQWLFLQPGEQLKQVTRREVFNPRCGGCHGAIDGNTANTVARADVITQASRVVANYDHVTDQDIPPVAFGLQPADRREVDFERDVQPLLTASCATAGCHVAGGRAPNLSARAGAAGFSGAYEALTASGTASGNGFGYVDADSSEARTSYLAEVLLGTELGAPRVFNSPNCPAAKDLPLKDVELLLRWMDLGASFRGIGPKTLPSLPEYP